ncbi:unnamed protein product [Dicrocoelium dendriticum]|nr:unnamed protein product [Dicrocoelium dendriticum]
MSGHGEHTQQKFGADWEEKFAEEKCQISTPGKEESKKHEIGLHHDKDECHDKEKKEHCTDDCHKPGMMKEHCKD